MPDQNFWLIADTIILLLLVIYLIFKLTAMGRSQKQLPQLLEAQSEAKHRDMLSSLNDGLNKQSHRSVSLQTEMADRLHASVSALQIAQTQNLAGNREALIKQLSELNASLSQKQDALKSDMLSVTLQKLAEQGRADQELIQTTMRNISAQLGITIEALNKTVDERLQGISGKVSERLDEGFKKTNETFTSVMSRLAVIDEAQKKIDGLTTNVVSLQQLLGDKRSRGAFGEVQLEALVRNVMPEQTYEFQATLKNGYRVDCLLKLPEPTGLVSVDSKFPLENFHKMYADNTTEAEKSVAQRQFKADVKKHVDDISSKYIIDNVTSDGAVMFLPAEAVFAEIHGYHSDIVDYANSKRVWIVSPTTLMAVLNTARAVMKDVETRKQVHIIKDELGKLGKDFGRFEERMSNLSKHINQASKDVEEVHTSSKKITDRFARIERVELETTSVPKLEIVKQDENTR
ncbi:MAG: DNA recombination protein RmuC [Burkholderiales bacterium]